MPSDKIILLEARSWIVIASPSLKLFFSKFSWTKPWLNSDNTFPEKKKLELAKKIKNQNNHGWWAAKVAPIAQRTIKTRPSSLLLRVSIPMLVSTGVPWGVIAAAHNESSNWRALHNPQTLKDHWKKLWNIIKIQQVTLERTMIASYIFSASSKRFYSEQSTQSLAPHLLKTLKETMVELTSPMR